MKRKFIPLLSACLAAGILLTGCGQSDANGETDSVSYKADQGINTYAQSADAVMEEGVSADSGEARGESKAMAAETAESETAAPAEGMDGSDIPAQSDRKLIRNMSLSLETTSFEDFIANVETQAGNMGGYIEDSSVSGGSGYESLRNSYMTVRIPADRLDDFADAITGSATVLNRSTSITDVTLQYSDLESHMEALKIEQKTLMDMLAKAEEIETVLAIQNQLTNVRYELESYGSQLKLMENQVSYSTVNIDVSEVEIPTSTEKDTFGSKVSHTFKNSMNGFARGTEAFLVWFLGNIVFITAFFAVVVLVFLGLRGLYQRHQKKKAKFSHTIPKENEGEDEDDQVSAK